MNDTAALIGRERETYAINARLDAVRNLNRGVALLIRGQAGIGKSALLARATDLAEGQGMRVLKVSGVRSERHVPFAGLHQMLRPLLERAQGLPEPQRDALLTTFGMKEAPVSNIFLIAVGALELLAKEAEKTPLLLLVDDAHWLDPPTADVLGFVARRLGSEPVALLIAVRDWYQTALVEFSLPELRVEALDDQSSSALLDSCAAELGPELRRRVLAAAAGNPLALVELAAAVSPSPPVLLGLPERLPMTSRLQQALIDRFLDLPAATRTLLLVASTDEQASLNELLTAAELLGEDAPASVDDLAPAIASGLVELDYRRVRFRNPLLPAAIYQVATPVQRHRVHAALARVQIADPDRRAWHRAAATTSPDEEVAAELERASLGAINRGTANITLALMERAAELTRETSRRHRRLLRAAEFALELGQLDRTSRLLGEIDPAACESLDRARMHLLRDMIERGHLADPKTVDSLVDSATRASSAGEIDLALRLFQSAAMCSWWADPGPDARDRVVAATRRVLTPDSDPRVLSILGLSDPAGTAAMISEIASQTAPDACDPKGACSLGTALHVTGAFPPSSAFLASAVGGLREQGGIWLLPQALAQQAWNAICACDWDLASAAGEEATRLALDTHQPRWEAAAQTARSAVAAIRGEVGAAESLLGDAEAIALPLGVSAVLADVQLVRALIALGDGRYDEAFQQLRRTFDPHDPAHHHFRSFWRIGEFAEAAVHAGHLEEAREQLARSEGLAKMSMSPRLEIGVLYARPLLADDDSVEAHFQTALSANITQWPLYRARLLLEYGTWLRRRRKIAQARLPLRAARDSLLALGAAAWAERARQELRASRETQHCRPDTWTQLTEQELQIACMAAEGLSNREIAQRLYVSHRTVGAHLYRIFPKFGITSRAQLPAVIGNQAPATFAS
jgi:DNA-binding CsgD family transcriptional regulator